MREVMNIRAGIFFPDKLNLYSDQGNAMILSHRARARGIGWQEVVLDGSTEVDFSTCDLFLIGGGSDREQQLCTQYLQEMKPAFQGAIESGVPGLAVCGGYQFLGNYYECANGEVLEGLGIFDYYSKASSSKREDRMTGNILVESPLFGRVVGFENHSGETFHTYDTLGDVVSGYGNNRVDKKEGFLYKHVIGTYLHGPLLSKNPRIADWMLERALERKYGKVALSPMDDAWMERASEIVWERTCEKKA